jgi:general L-amino acid transport system substrate-binding protein
MHRRLLGWSAIALLCLGAQACARLSSKPATAPGQAETSAKGRLATVLSRGKLVCGVSGELPGFSFLGKDGNYGGLDVDICRAVASALFNNPQAVEFRNLNAKERFTALQSGEVDLLSRNTTYTVSRDTSVGLEFAPTVFYDGQGVMVKKGSGIRSVADLGGKAICIQTGTTTEQNLTDQMRKKGLTYTPVVFEDVNTTFATYGEGRCEGVTADRSQLVSRRSTLPKPDEHIVLPDVLSKEPLAPAIASGDAAWGDVVRWTIYALIEAEEMNLTAQTVTEQSSNPDPTVRRLLGLEGDLGKGMGLSNDFALRIIKHVGNYGEIYERNMGAKTPLNLPRGQNQLWSKGGLLYSPPFR